MAKTRVRLPQPISMEKGRLWLGNGLKKQLQCYWQLPFLAPPKALFLVPQRGSTACMGTGSGAWDGTSTQERATLVPEGPALKVRCVNVI